MIDCRNGADVSQADVSSDARDDAVRAWASTKIKGWVAAGFLEVWSVDPGSRTVTVHTNSSGTRSVGELDPLVSTAVPGLSVALADLFPPISSSGTDTKQP